MLDGVGFVRAMRQAGGEPAGERALLIGAGGAGSAIGLQLLDAGVSELAIHDMDAGRRDALISRLSAAYPRRVRAGSTDPDGFGIIANATPLGMRAGDPLPVAVEKLAPGMFIGDVITAPEVSPLLEAGRSLGCKTQTGLNMFLAQRELIVDFLEGKPV